MTTIEIKSISKSYIMGGDETVVVADLNLSVERGRVFGFLGPNGAGKTTTMKMLVGLCKPDEGEIKILGSSPYSREVKKKIGFMPENPSFYSYLTGREFLEFAADIFGIANKKTIIEALLEKVNLKGAGNLPIRKYSKGMCQRLGLAQALINDPEVIFLDEPLDGLDPLGRKEAKELILDLKESGKTIFFNSHILADVEDLADEVGIIDQGRLIAQGEVKLVKNGYQNLEEAFVSIIRKKRGDYVAAY